MSSKELALFMRDEPAVSQTNEKKGKWLINEKTPYQNQRLADVTDKFQRQPTGFIEFHSMLVRREIFEKIGMLDEGFSCTKEYLDFAMSVNKAGGEIYLEPESVVTFLTHPPAPALKWEDLPYFMLRWSDAWELNSLVKLREKWNLAEDGYFQHKYKALGWRRRDTILMPIVRSLTFGIQNQFLQKVLMYGLFAPMEKILNRYLTNVYAKKYLQPKSTQSTPVVDPEKALSKV